MSVGRRSTKTPGLQPEADEIARQALRETRLRGLPAAEEYRVIADRLYRSGVRDLPNGLLIDWIEQTVADHYEDFLELRALGERLHAAIATGDLATATWELASNLDRGARQRIAQGLVRIDELDPS